MRARNIKPDFFTDEKLINLTFAERLFFIGLWCYSDSEGFFEVKPHEMKLKLFPDQKVDIMRMLKSLENAGVVKLHGQHGFLPNFTKHQRPHPREKKSIVPIEVKEQAVKLNGQPCNYPASPSDIMNVDVMNDDIMKDERGKMKGKDCSLLFERLWERYPVKRDKQEALSEFKKLNLKNGDFEELFNNLNKQIAFKEKCLKNNKFCPEFKYLSRWLKKGTWRDGPDLERSSMSQREIELAEAEKKARAEYGHLVNEKK